MKQPLSRQPHLIEERIPLKQGLKHIDLLLTGTDYED